MTARLLLLAALLAAPPATWSQEAPSAPGANAPPESTAPTQQPAPAEGADDESSATRAANDRFKPSEKISEDLSVSFPADI